MQKHELMMKLKKNNLLSYWCKGPCKDLLNFANEVESLDFTTKPNYGKLGNILQSLIHIEKRQKFKLRYEDTFKNFEKEPAIQEKEILNTDTKSSLTNGTGQLTSRWNARVQIVS